MSASNIPSDSRHALTLVAPCSRSVPADKQADSWNPSRFDASDWIALMKRAGVKYFDFTAKH